MNVIMLGDVVGSAGCDYLRERMPLLKSRYQPDIIVANGENSAEGNGITPHSAKHLFDSGVNVITTGNHGLRRREVFELLDRQSGVIRPANYHPEAPGAGLYLYDTGRLRLTVINLQGITYLQPNRNPFDCIDEILEGVETPCVLLDFHAEATSEKLCMGYYLDGRVSAVLGTHTHVPTADACVLPGGTGYQTDVGMCGGERSVLGVKRELALRRMRTNLPTRFENDPRDIRISGAVLDLDDATGRCRAIESIVRF